MFQRQNNIVERLVIVMGILVCLLIVTIEANSQDQGFIYGKVTTSENNTYQGYLRWGGEEMLWIDHFNSSKTTNTIRFLSQGKRFEIDKKKYVSDTWLGIDLSMIWDDRQHETVHQFACSFGDIRALEYRRNDVYLTLKNDIEIIVGGSGYNDVRADVTVDDYELGRITVDGDRIRKVEFMNAPQKSPLSEMHYPITGVVSTFRGEEFDGFVEWDTDEKHYGEKLDGDTRDGDVSIRFENIASIEKIRGGNASRVELRSGRVLELDGSNDVDDGNRGIVVSSSEIGRVKIPWEYFEKVEFGPINNNSGVPYSTFPPPKGIKGSVETRRDTYEGMIIYDLDEAWEFELLDGEDYEIQYSIPFRNIKRIVPKNSSYSQVDLKNGKRILLGNGRDVDEDNAGVLVFTSADRDPIYIEWRDILEINFE